MILGSGHCLVGDAVLIGPNCIIVSGSHNSINGSYRYGKGIKGCIEIKKELGWQLIVL